VQAGANSQLLPRLRQAPGAASARLHQTVQLGLDWRAATPRGSLFVAVASALLTAGILYLAAHPHAVPDLLIGLVVAALLFLSMGTLVVLVRRQQRLFLGGALADLLDRLTSDSGRADVERAMAETLHDPSLSVLYRGDRSDAYVDGHGASVDAMRESSGRSVARIDVEGRPAAIVLFDRHLRHQRRFVAAAGEAALLWLHKAHLEDELSASTHDLEVSRRRLLDAAVSERQRIQRDLHDSAQQHLVGMRVKLGLAQGSIGRDRARTERLLSGLQCELEAALQEVRSLANGVYPAVLTQYGLAGALKAACRRASMPVSLQTHGLARYSRDMEGAVYFTCVEAIQNSEKHAGRRAQAVLHIWQDRDRLRFVVRDSGVGFDRALAESGTGLLSMRDRIEAVGGALTVASAPHAGTIVSGDVPLRKARRSLRARR
jgi:signal transduction histidine kinase